MFRLKTSHWVGREHQAADVTLPQHILESSPSFSQLIYKCTFIFTYLLIIFYGGTQWPPLPQTESQHNSFIRCVVTNFSQHTLKLLCSDSVWGTGSCFALHHRNFHCVLKRFSALKIEVPLMQIEGSQIWWSWSHGECCFLTTSASCSHFCQCNNKKTS